jgi:hypothetical protein
MQYDEFKSAWTTALKDSGLGVFGAEVHESLDLTNLNRRYEVSVLPLGGGGDAEPLLVTAGLSWRWDALQEARTASTEEDMLHALLGQDQADVVETEEPWLRVDVTLRATLPWGKPLPMPNQQAQQNWMREVVGRLERTEPLLPDEVVEESPDGNLAVLAWRGEPEIRATCAADGVLMVERVELASWQAINPPRVWDDPDRWDEGPEDQLAAFFARVRQALHVWMECLDHLTRRR